MIGRGRSLGIRLDGDTATFAEVERLFGRVRVVNSGTINLSREPTATGAALVLQDGARRSRLDAVVVGLPRHQVVCRFIDLPNVEDERLAGLLSYEIERHLPFPVEEACYSYQKLSVAGSLAHMLIAAAKRTDVEHVLEQTARLGVRATAVDVMSIAATGALYVDKMVPASERVAFIQLAGPEAIVNVLCHGAVVSSRTITLPSDAATNLELEKEFPVWGGAVPNDALHPDRVPVEGYLSFATDSTMGEGTVVNLSRNGACVSSAQTVEVGASMKLSIMLSDTDDPLDVPLARVQWAARGLFGLEFINFDQDVRSRIVKSVSESAGQDVPEHRISVISVAQSSCGMTADKFLQEDSRRYADGYVTFSGDGIEGEGTVANISRYGWRVISDQRVKTGMLLSLQAALSELNDPVDISAARVHWIGTGEFGLRILAQDAAISARSACSDNSGHGSMLSTKSGEARGAVLLSELQRAAQTAGGLPERIYVSGNSDELCRALHDAVHVPVEAWNVTAAGADPIAFGLALRGFAAGAARLDLLPVERRIHRPERTGAVFSSLLALVCLLALAWWGSEAVLERRRLVQIEDELYVVKREADNVAALQKEYVALTGRLQVLDGLASAQGRSTILLKEVVLLLPPDVSLQEFTLDGNKLRLRGSTSASAAMLIAAFEHSALLENAAFTAPISVLGKDRQAFEIAATVRARPSMDAVNAGGKGAL